MFASWRRCILTGGYRMKKYLLAAATAAALTCPAVTPSMAQIRTDAQMRPIQTESGWTYLNDSNPEVKRFRKYAYYGETGFRNSFIFNCSKNEGHPYSNITIVFPSWLNFKSFPRNVWYPNFNFRILVDNTNSYGLSGEYQDGELYFDETPQTSDIFRSILEADDLSVGFGDENDVVTFKFTEKVDGAMAEAKTEGIIKELRNTMHYSRAEVFDECAQYQHQ
jgi:hypothetical protein